MRSRVCAALAVAVILGLCAPQGAALKANTQKRIGCQESYTADEISKLITVVVTASARPSDVFGNSLAVLKYVWIQIRNKLQLPFAQSFMAFDGEPTQENVTTFGAKEIPEPHNEFYHQKIKSFKRWNKEKMGGSVNITEMDTWMHTSEMLRSIFRHLEETNKLTPLVFVTKDDSPIAGNVSMPDIVKALMCDNDVEYIRFIDKNDCTEDPEHNSPCTAHESKSWLQKVVNMTDSPHFATSTFYNAQVFGKVPRRYRGNPEPKVGEISHAWTYGERKAMKHRDTNYLPPSFNP